MTKKTKKVAIFVDGVFIPSYSGASNRFHYLTRTLQQNTDTEMIVILCDRGWSNLKQVSREKFKTYLVHPALFKNIEFLSKILTREKVNIIQFANLETAVELGIQLSYKLNIHVVFESHYEDYEFAKSVGANKETLQKVKYLQNNFGKYFDKIISLSGEDTGKENNLKIDPTTIAVIPSGVNLNDFPVSCFNINSKKLICFGNLYFEANLKTIKEIKKVIYKELSGNGFKFYMIGDISLKDRNALEDKNFIVTGKQAILFKSFNNTTIGLAPVTDGSGIRIKILNYLNAGIPVITTSQGARGFRRKELLIIEDNLPNYPNLIRELVTEKTRLLKLSKEGRKYIRGEMSWEKISAIVSAQYDNILSRPVKNKTDAITILQNIEFNEPPWIKEMIDKKRFKRNLPFVKKNDHVILSHK